MARRAGGCAIAAGAALVLLSAGCGVGPGGPPAQAYTGTPTPSSGTPADALWEGVLLLDFTSETMTMSEGARVRDATGGGHVGVVRTGGPSPVPLATVERAAGDLAVVFPAPCLDAPERCPKAIIELDDAPALNPGDDDFRFGASVRLEPTQTTAGSNIMQKGFSTGGGSQWKLQVDGELGRPSCVLVGPDDDVAHEATAYISIADGLWHDVSCVRRGAELIIELDGEARTSARVPPELAVDPPGAVRLGGKNLKPDNDQFFGTLDDVFYEVPAHSAP